MKQVKPNYNMNALMDECISRFEDTFLLLQDTPDFLPTAVSDIFVEGITRAMKRTWKSLVKYDKRYQKSLRPPSWLKRLFMRKRATPQPPIDEPPKEMLPADMPTKDIAECKDPKGAN